MAKQKNAVLLKRILAAVCSGSMALSVFAGLPGFDNANKAKAYQSSTGDARTTIAPTNNLFSVERILNWNPETDADARYLRSTVPMNDRFSGPLVNEYANKDAKLMGTAIESDASDEMMNYVFTYWQYLDSFTHWGSPGRGEFVMTPLPDVIDAAHKNGVPISGTQFFNQFEGSVNMAPLLVQDENGKFPAAEQLKKIAEYYGFDGYFVNEEASVGQALATKYIQFMKQLQENKPENFEMTWYDAMLPSGSVSWQNELNNRNVSLFQDGSDRVSDLFFLNFNWDYGSQIDNSKATAESVGRSPFDVYAGLDTQTNSYNTSRFKHSKIFGKGTAKTSLGFYTMSSTLAMSVTPEDFYRNEQIFWVGANGDPTNTASNSTGPSNWKGMAHHYADKSVINDLPFSTNFNTGHGKKYFIDGELSRNKEWSNRSTQDILPTWRWDIESEGSKLTADFDFDDAYYGGNSIKLSGSLDANKANIIKLYSTDLVMNSNIKASVTYKTPADATNLKVGFAINASLEEATYDNYDFVYYDLPAGTPGEWTTTEITLGEQYQGKHITAVSLKAESSSDVKDYEVNIGNISISEFDAEPAQMGKVSNPEIDDVLFHDARTAEVKMIWDKAEGDVMYYEIYRVHANGSKEYVGTTTRDAYYIPEIIRDGSEDHFNFEIVPVDAMYNHGQATTLRFDWDLPLSATEEDVVEEPVNLAYLKPTNANAWYDAEPPAKAVDGTAKNGSKWCTASSSNTWMTVDLGQVETIERWAVWHANHPDALESEVMNTRDFRLQVQKGDGTFEDVDIVKGNKADITDRNLAEPVEGQVFRLYIDYAHNGSPWGATRIYEFQLFEKPLLGTKTEANIPENIVAVNNEGANDTVTVRGVTAGQTVNLYTSLESKEAIASKVADGSTVVFEGLDLGAEAGYVYMTQTSPDLIESIKIGSAYEAEGLAALAKPNVKIVNNGAAKFSEISVLNLKAGDVVKVYNTMDDTFAAISVTVPYGADMANIRNQVLNAEGGELIMELVRAGSGTTGKFTVAYNDKGTVDPENPAPVITGAPESGASRTPVTLTADKNVKFVINGVTDEDYRTSVTLKDEGVYTVKAIDENGVESDEITFAIDRTAPVLTADCEHYGVTNKDVTFSTNETVTFTVNGVEKNTGTELVLNESGVYTVYAMDAAGNRSAIYRVTIQKSAPELTLTGVEDNGVTRNNVSIRSNNRVTYYVNDEFAGDFVFGLKVVEEGTYTVKAVDLAGNESVVNFTIDRTKPVFEANIKSGVLTNEDITLKANESVNFVVNDEVVATGTEYTITDNGVTVVYVYDLAGNYGGVYKANIDKTVPVLNAVIEGTNIAVENGATTNKNVTITTSKKASFIINDGEPTAMANYVKLKAEGTYTVKAVDALGNVSETFTVTIDK